MIPGGDNVLTPKAATESEQLAAAIMRSALAEGGSATPRDVSSFRFVELLKPRGHDGQPRWHRTEPPQQAVRDFAEEADREVTAAAVDELPDADDELPYAYANALAIAGLAHAEYRDANGRPFVMLYLELADRCVPLAAKVVALLLDLSAPHVQMDYERAIRALPLPEHVLRAALEVQQQPHESRAAYRARMSATDQYLVGYVHDQRRAMRAVGAGPEDREDDTAGSDLRIGLTPYDYGVL